MNAHTSTPWHLGSDKLTVFADCGQIIREPATGKFLQAPVDVEMANAAFIVRACNSHDELVEALKQVMGWISNWSPNFETDEDWQTVAKPQILSAIAKAEACQ